MVDFVLFFLAVVSIFLFSLLFLLLYIEFLKMEFPDSLSTSFLLLVEHVPYLGVLLPQGFIFLVFFNILSVLDILLDQLHKLELVLDV